MLIIEMPERSGVFRHCRKGFFFINENIRIFAYFRSNFCPNADMRLFRQRPNVKRAASRRLLVAFLCI